MSLGFHTNTSLPLAFESEFFSLLGRRLLAITIFLVFFSFSTKDSKGSTIDDSLHSQPHSQELFWLSKVSEGLSPLFTICFLMAHKAMW